MFRGVTEVVFCGDGDDTGTRGLVRVGVLSQGLGEQVLRRDLWTRGWRPVGRGSVLVEVVGASDTSRSRT